MTDMRERVARAICEAEGYSYIPAEHYDRLADAALSIMQPEIDRRVAEERAKLLERLRDAAENLFHGGFMQHLIIHTEGPAGAELKARCDILLSALAQFEKENSDD